MDAKKWLVATAVGMGAVLSWQLWSSGQQPGAGQVNAGDSNRLQFEVVQSFDAKYEGDTPGHMGRAGGLQNRRPRVALGDAIYRGEEKVGSVTGLAWNRTNGSLDIEFDPVTKDRVCVGDQVWMKLDEGAGAGTTEPQRGK